VNWIVFVAFTASLLAPAASVAQEQGDRGSGSLVQQCMKLCTRTAENGAQSVSLMCVQNCTTAANRDPGVIEEVGHWPWPSPPARPSAN
jgi:hypothetical protein